MTSYIEPFIPIHFDTINTLRVSCRDTPCFENAPVTDSGEGSRQKILVRQVFDRCVIVRVSKRDSLVSVVSPVSLTPGKPGRYTLFIMNRFRRLFW